MPAVLNVGGGSKSIAISPIYAQWQHDLLDLDPRSNAELFMDARQLKNLPAGTYDAVYCSHNLEHYHRADAAIVVRGFHHVLKPDGFAEIYVPDILALMRHVVQHSMDLDDLLYQSPAGPVYVRDVIYGHHLEVEAQGLAYYSHKTGFSPKTIARFMAENGFPAHAIVGRTPIETGGYFFKQHPTPEQMKMLGLTPVENPSAMNPGSAPTTATD